MRAVLLGLIAIAVNGSAQDFQQWGEVDLTASWGKVDFLVPLLARTDTGLPNPQLAATGITADVPLPWTLTLTAGYLYADLPQRSDQVHIPLVALTKSSRLGPVRIADRNRFEKLFGYPREPVRYRNRIMADLPLGLDDRWHIFVGDEIFFNLSAGAWNQNRLQAGGGVKFNRHFSLDAYYLQRNAAGGAHPTHVLGTTLRVAVKTRR